MKINAACSTAVSAVNGQSNLPAGCGDVPVAWKDDQGKVYKITLKNVLHFPNSPVKILSVVGLADQLKDNWDTWILSRRHQSLFTWAFGKFSKTILHGKSKLPDLLIKSGTYSNMNAFYSLVQKSTTADNHLVFNTAIKMDKKQITDMENNDLSQGSVYNATSPVAYSNEEELKDNENFTVEHDVSIPPIPTLSIGCSVRYIQDDHVEVGKLIGVDLSNPASPTHYDILFPGGRTVQTTREHIELEETPDIFDILTKAKAILEVASSLSKKDLNAILNPDVLTPLQQL